MTCALLAGGCGQREARVLRTVLKPGPGYAYTAVLMGAHPLYETLARLELASELLGREDSELDPTLLGPPLEPVTLVETLAYGPEQDSLALRQQWWADQYNRQWAIGEQLPRDLWAGLEWEREDAERQVQARMAVAEAELSRKMARLRARLVREQQERLNNLGLDLSRSESDVQRAAELERDRIWRSIERQIELARRAGEQELAALRADLEAEAAQRVARAQQRAEDIARERREQMASAGDVLHDEMAGEIETDTVSTLPAQSAQVDPSQANRQLAAGAEDWAKSERAWQQSVEQQRRELLRAEARLRNRLKQDTELWAMVVARRHDIDLQLLPGGRAQGRDVTASLAAELAQVWRSGRHGGGRPGG